MQKQYYIDVEVDGKKVKLICNRWSPMKCFGNLPKIGKAFAVPMSMMISEDEEDFAEKLPQALFMLFDTMEEQDTWELFQLITEDVFINNGTERLDLNEHLGYDLGTILLVVAEALKGNYGSLFTKGGLSSLFSQMSGLAQVAQQN